MRRLIRQSPEVTMVTSQTGRNESGTDPFGPNRNEFLLDLKSYETWPRGQAKANLVDELSASPRSPASRAPRSTSRSRSSTRRPRSPPDSSGRSRRSSSAGPTSASCRALATAGARGAAADPRRGRHLDRARGRSGAASHRGESLCRSRATAINVSDVQDVIDLALGGSPITAVFEGDRRFDVVARFAPEARADPSSIGSILIPTRDGARVPLAQLADITRGRRRDASSPGGRTSGRSRSARTSAGATRAASSREAQARFAEAVKLPPGYRVSWGGQFENFDRARQRLVIIIPITIGVIFAAAVPDLRVCRSTPASCCLNVPVLARRRHSSRSTLRDINLSVSAAVGFISLFGVAVMSGVLHHLRREPPACRRLRGRWPRPVVGGALARSSGRS